MRVKSPQSPDSTHSEQCRWHPIADMPELQNVALNMILDSAAAAIRTRGQFHFVLAGGDTPRAIYKQLRAAHTDWTAWYVYFGDERCVSPTDPRRNSVMAGEAWLDYVEIPADQLYTIPGELGADLAACEYAQTLNTVGIFDLTLLGLGEDGHTASLFPGHEWGTEPDSPDTLAVLNAPKPPPQRVSLSAARLSRSRQVIFLVGGESKRDAVARWRAGENIPPRAIAPEKGVDVLVESALLKPL
ncbi:6-phosphogluconolactonase [Nitrosospira sp. Nsp13]|nr:6-phosphogluconolactonase [Nitrosospira sp. Nsp13]